jgi:hypothetical protein
VRTHSPAVLARALHKVGAAQVPVGATGVAGPVPAPPASEADAVLRRACRLVSPPPLLSPAGRAAVVLGTAGVLLLPVLGIVGPDLSRLVAG